MIFVSSGSSRTRAADCASIQGRRKFNENERQRIKEERTGQKHKNGKNAADVAGKVMSLKPSVPTTIVQ